MNKGQILSGIYNEKNFSYYQFTRVDIIKELPPNQVFYNVLEIGASGGYTLLYLKMQKIALHVTGIELFKFKDTEQENPNIDEFIISNIEEMPLNTFSSKFDLIICGDVLEHLADPWSVRDKIVNWLMPGGLLIVSIPNVRELKTILKVLLRGTFTYEEGGVMDKTHLRFFCKKNIIDLLNTHHLKVKKISTNLKYPVWNTKRRSLVNKLTFKIFENFLAKQYLVTTVKEVK